MDYRLLFKESNEEARERYELAIDRIRQMKDEHVKDNYDDYFKKVSAFILQIDKLWTMVQTGELKDKTLEELQKLNRELYEDILPDNYEVSYANPAYAAQKLGVDNGRLLSFMYMEIRGMIIYAYESRLTEITILCELFIEVYNWFEDEDEPDAEEIRKILYWFISDYADVMVEYGIREIIDPELSFAKDIIMNSDLSDVSYLYKFGEYISENEIKTAQFLSKLSKEDIDKMAYTYVEGFRKGFELANKPLAKKKTVNIRYTLGFERIVKSAIEQFAKLGLDVVMYRSPVNSSNKNTYVRTGYSAISPNKQMDYDHRNDNALYFDKAFMERKLGVIKCAYEKYKELAYVHAGPAVMEIFGETPFEPINKKECFTLDEKQQKLLVNYRSENQKIVNEYIKGEERSFTIIAYPIPEIGDKFEEIFAETVRINTLDYERYCKVQENIIDALNEADYVYVEGSGENKTKINVNLLELKNKETETLFENCLADVNIPLGEVFTSPKLTGTNGILNVSEVYLKDIKFINLTITFKDGMIQDYTCDNFETEEENKELIKQVILNNHDTLAIGEFAIGTNTTAYVMANKYDIVYKLPILIVEKMGPHFAVGDTCYTWSEDIKVYNPDGKEIIAKDNEVSIARKEDIKKAYYGCHTDITIPYDEIAEITAVKKDGSRITIIKDGRFVLEGTELLNEPFNEQNR